MKGFSIWKLNKTANGKLYGMTYFDGPNGKQPRGGLLQVSNGRLNVSSLTKRVYFVKVEHEGKIGTHKILKK